MIHPFLYYALLIILCGQLSLAQDLSVDIIFGKLDISITTEPLSVQGKVSYKIDVRQLMDTLSVDAHNMQIEQVRLNGQKAIYLYDNKKIIFTNLKPKKYNLCITYQVHPQQAMYTVKLANSEVPQIWTQGQGKNNSHWVPSFDDPTKKITFDIRIRTDKRYTLLSNGRLRRQRKKKQYIFWRYKMSHPMSSYLLAVVAGQYVKDEQISSSGVPIEVYVHPSNSLKISSTYRYTKRIFDFLEEEIGVSYPWEVYREIPVRDFIYGGMENTTLTIFPDTDVIDSIAMVDRPFIKVSAHELAHHWFGNMVTARTSKHHWLQEGFATYYSLLAEREILGEAYYQEQLFHIIQALLKQNERLENEHASSFTYYQKGAYVLHLLRDKIGDTAFQKSVQQYLNYHAFGTATTDSFITIVQEVSGLDLTKFVNGWIRSDDLPITDIYNDIAQHYYLEKAFREVATDSEVRILPKNDLSPLENKIILSAWIRASNPRLSKVFRAALQTGQTSVQQYALASLDSFPKVLQSDIESLLEERSYTTQALALDRLCNSFPSKIASYLNIMADERGDTDRNVRMIWLRWAIQIDFQTKKNIWTNELFSYTASNYSFVIRREAFDLLDKLEITLSRPVLANLIEACVHHYHKFRNDTRKYLKKILKTKEIKSEIDIIFDRLSTEAQAYLGQL